MTRFPSSAKLLQLKFWLETGTWPTKSLELVAIGDEGWMLHANLPALGVDNEGDTTEACRQTDAPGASENVVDCLSPTVVTPFWLTIPDAQFCEATSKMRQVKMISIFLAWRTLKNSRKKIIIISTSSQANKVVTKSNTKSFTFKQGLLKDTKTLTKKITSALATMQTNRLLLLKPKQTSNSTQKTGG